MTKTMSGGCQCGRVRYEADLENDDAYWCHCRMCQKATGGIAAAFVQAPEGAVRWLTEPDWYESSAIAHRPFCAQCGTPLGFAFLDGKGRTDLTVGSFDDPSAFRRLCMRERRASTKPGSIPANCPALHRHHQERGEPLCGGGARGSGMSEVKEQSFPGFDGELLKLHIIGEGRPIILLHGLFSSAPMNWLKFGHAETVAAQGYEVLMPDLRAHGASAAPHDPAAYPRDVLVRDLAALIEYLGIEDYDLGGFSLGARTVLHAVAKAAVTPARLIVGGMGVAGLTDWEKRAAHFTRVIDEFEAIPKSDSAWYAVQFLKSQKIDRTAARLLIGSFTDLPLDLLDQVTMPTLVVCGDEDRDNGSAAHLAARLPSATYVEVPGTHMGSVARRELGRAIAEWLGPADGR